VSSFQLNDIHYHQSVDHNTHFVGGL